MLRVMTLNILFGGEERMPRLLEVIKEARPDLLILQECLGWEDGARLAQVADALGIPSTQAHLALARPRGSGRCFHLTVFSRAPLTLRRVHNDPHFIAHCIAEYAITYQGEPLIVIGAHLDAHHENLRFVEARYLRAQLDEAAFSSGYYLLAGDLNSLSSKSPYPEDLAEKMKRAGTEKYGLPPRFEVISELESFGWVDALWHNGPPTAWVTASRSRGGVHIDYRTDYLFASPRLAERLISAEVIDVGGASDHNAVLAIFE